MPFPSPHFLSCTLISLTHALYSYSLDRSPFIILHFLFFFIISYPFPLTQYAFPFPSLSYRLHLCLFHSTPVSLCYYDFHCTIIKPVFLFFIGFPFPFIQYSFFCTSIFLSGTPPSLPATIPAIISFYFTTYNPIFLPFISCPFTFTEFVFPLLLSFLSTTHLPLPSTRCPSVIILKSLPF